jgi:hypothetical protein
MWNFWMAPGASMVKCPWLRLVKTSSKDANSATTVAVTMIQAWEVHAGDCSRANI